MSTFGYRNGHYHAEDVPLRRIADDIGTPFYCYSRSAIESNYRAYTDALQEFESDRYDPRAIRRHAEQFDAAVFRQKMHDVIVHACEEHTTWS